MLCSRYRFAEVGKDGVDRLWQLPEAERPIAIVGGYGYITQGIDVPGEVSVVSMDSDPNPLDAVRQVSCIPSGIDAICAEVIRVKRIGRVGQSRNETSHIVVSGEFRRGETVGKAQRS